MEDQDVSPVSLFAREHGLEAEVEAQLSVEGCTDDAIEQQLTNSITSSDGKGAREPSHYISRSDCSREEITR